MVIPARKKLFGFIPHRFGAGFTLIELLIVIAILGQKKLKNSGPIKKFWQKMLDDRKKFNYPPDVALLEFSLAKINSNSAFFLSVISLTTA